MRKLVPMLALVIFLISGCWDQRDLEKISLDIMLGIEKGQSKQLLVTRTFPVIGAGKEDLTGVISSEGDLTRESTMEADKVSSQLIEGGKLQQILFSREVAESGIQNILEFFERQARMPIQAWVVGAALFRGAKMVGQIDTQETSLLLAMKKQLKTATYKANIGQGAKEGMVVGLSNFQRKLRIFPGQEALEVEISLAFRGTVLEYEWDGLDKDEEAQRIKELIGSQLTRDCREKKSGMRFIKTSGLR